MAPNSSSVLRPLPLAEAPEVNPLEAIRYNDWASLTEILKHMAARTIILIAPPEDQAYRSAFHAMVKEHGAEDRALFILDAVADQTTAQIEALLAERGNGCDLIVLGPSLRADMALLWMNNAPRLLTSRGLLHGAQQAGLGLANHIVSIATQHKMSVMLGDDFWYAIPSAFHVPGASQFYNNGGVQPVHFASMDEDLTAVGDRDVFLHLSRAGIPCRLQQGGGTPFENPPPRNFDSKEAMLSKLKFTNGYQESGVSEGRSLAFLKNVKIAGNKSYLYSNHNGLYEESFTTGRFQRPGAKSNLHTHDRGLGIYKFGTDSQSIPHLGLMFPNPTHSIDTPVVITYCWDLWCYNHFVSYTLSRFWYLDQLPELGDLPIVIGALSRPFHRDYLEILGLTDKTFIYVHPSATLKFSSAYHVSLADMPQHTAGSAQWLRDKCFDDSTVIPEGYRSGLYYISRKDTFTRQIQNENELLETLNRYGFQTIEWSQFTIREQIALARNAKVVIAPHGSSLTNLVFMPPHSTVVDLATRSSTIMAVPTGCMSWEICFTPHALQMDYYAIPAEEDGIREEQAGYKVPAQEFRNVIEKIMQEHPEYLR